MYSLFKPSRSRIEAFLSAPANREFSYPKVGATRGRPPEGYKFDHNRIQLGEGAEAFARAVQAVRQWKMFDMPWLQICWPDAPIRTGTTVAVLVSHFGFWSLNPARIVYVIEENGRSKEYGFAYGTLNGHAEMGEERFAVELRLNDQSVWYDLAAFSRPAGLARLGYPFSRTLQRRFIRDSQNAMLRAVARR